ncbi:MAG: response regulator transcription factor [Chloroflexi bacterium]|nr:response regulator transcription factor [Chloroflexota bacterium]MYB21427.1 response regulator transcription factor [Chloroflexota bacterium]MYD17922.1 response regulator transcription factor [Chloroflexota bacterium]MYF81317.1 response regulator transcription factor [Chloroflexota bacterium]MYI04506.1 response regulator transcription factor [Chloroflexota bacterium]
MPRTLLVVEDERPLAETLRFNLEMEGYRVRTAEDGLEGLSMARALQPDLVLLDLMLPRMDGLEVLRGIREHSQAPVLLLTARTSEADRVKGLDLGADDYITKPFSLAELKARVRAHLRRKQEVSVEDRVLTFGEFTLDLNRRLLSRHGEPIALRPKEYELLAYLAQRDGRAFTRDQLLNDVWDISFAGGTRTVDVHVRWLRMKIEQPDGPPRHLITVRGAGYRFER